jgi:cell division protein FtsB
MAMQIWRTLKRAVRAMIPPAFFLSLVAYFAWNVTHGDRGLVAYVQRQQMMFSVKADLARAQAEQATWEHKVAGLRATHIDRDALDQQARANLNLADPADIIVPFSGKQKLF